MSTELSNIAKDLAELQTKYPDKLKHFVKQAKHIEGTELCSIELPCSYKDKTVSILVSEV